MARPTDKRWKGIILDWPTLADFDTEDYELKPLNQQQVAILLALLEYQKWPTRWTGLEMDKSQLETYIADIEERLMRNEGGDMTAQDIRDGIYWAFNDMAAQLKSGSIGGFTVGEDGTVTYPTAGDTPVELPPDDPATPYDDSLAAQMGGTIEVTKALELLYDKCDSLYGTVNGTPTTPQADAQTLIKAFFPCDGGLMDTAVATYYTYRSTTNRLLFDVTAAMQLYVFCRGGGERAWNQWTSENITPIGKFNVMNSLSTALSEDFWSGYFASGSTKPSTQYLDAGCVKIAPQTLSGLVFATARTTTPLKSQHRMRIQAKGYVTDTDGDIQDTFWYRTAAGVLTRSHWTFSHGAGANLPSDNQVVYNTAHVYDYTLDLAALNGAMTITPNKNAGINATGLVTNVAFEITMTDLGEYAV